MEHHHSSNPGELTLKSTAAVTAGERVASCYQLQLGLGGRCINYLLVTLPSLAPGKLLEKNVLEFRVLVLITGKQV